MGFNEYLKRNPIFDSNGNKLNLTQIQARIWQNKLNKGFNTTDPWREFAYLMGEFGELAEAIRNPEREDVVEALVDMLVFVIGMFELYKENTAVQVSKKIALNSLRKYSLSVSGYPIKQANQKQEVTEFTILNNLTEISQQIMLNKQKHGFNLEPKKIEHEFVLLGEELSELFAGLKTGNKSLILDALADVFILATGVISINKIDVYEVLTKKIVHNEARIYKKAPNGELLKTVND